MTSALARKLDPSITQAHTYIQLRTLYALQRTRRGNLSGQHRRGAGSRWDTRRMHDIKSSIILNQPGSWRWSSLTTHMTLETVRSSLKQRCMFNCVFASGRRIPGSAADSQCCGSVGVFSEKDHPTHHSKCSCCAGRACSQCGCTGGDRPGDYESSMHSSKTTQPAMRSSRA